MLTLFLMNYCPGCQEPLEPGQEQCPYCGYELIATKKEEEKEPESFLPDPKKKPFYKKASFLVPLVILLLLGLLIGSSIAGYAVYRNKQQDAVKKEMNAIWIQVVNRSEQLSESIDSMKLPTDLEDLKEELISFNELLAEKQTQAVNLDTPFKYEDSKDSLIDGIEKYSKYLYLLKLVLQKEAAQVRTEDYAKIKERADEAEAATSKFVAEASYIDDILPTNVFNAVKKVKSLTEKTKKEESLKKKKEQEQQKIIEKRAAEKAVRSFEQARIDQQGAEMRRYITPDYGKVFDPETEFKVEDAYLTDFKITKTETVPDKPNVFEISGEEVGKDLTGARFINKWWFNVIKYEGDWLIDNRRLLNE